MKAYNKQQDRGGNTKGWNSMSKPHPNRRNKLRVDKKAARQESREIVKKEQE